MGWFTETTSELVSTGKVVAEERATGSRLTELGKFVAIVAAIWVLGSVHIEPKDSHVPQKPAPTVTVTIPPP